MSDFQIEITELIRRTVPVPAVLGEVTQFSDVWVKETLNAPTEMGFSVSMHDAVVQHIVEPNAPAGYIPPDYAGHGAYTFAVRVYYRGQSQPCFWAPCTFRKDFGAARVHVSGVDMIRPMHHFLRIGDAPPLDMAGDDGLVDEGDVTVDYVGIEEILDAAQNTPGQDTRDVPSLGFQVNAEVGAPTRTAKIGVERSMGVWEQIRAITEHRLGPDIWIDFADNISDQYGTIRVYGQRGSDRTATVRWFYGVEGEDDNVSQVVATPLTPVTHAHVVASDRTQIRETAADALESLLRGVFVSWTATDMNSRGKDEIAIREALEAAAQAVVDAYATAPEQVEITLRPDAAQTAYWREHFWVGDTVYFRAERGYVSSGGDLRIRSVEVREDGPRGLATTKVEVVPDVTSADDGEES